jgi:hypothetical protein
MRLLLCKPRRDNGGHPNTAFTQSQFHMAIILDDNEDGPSGQGKKTLLFRRK